jgi:hypothetical protein
MYRIFQRITLYKMVNRPHNWGKENNATAHNKNYTEANTLKDSRRG